MNKRKVVALQDVFIAYLRKWVKNCLNPSGELDWKEQLDLAVFGAMVWVGCAGVVLGLTRVIVSL